MKPETKRTFVVAITLCLVCSVIVSSLAVGLKPIQARQKEAFRQQSILEAADLWQEGADAGALYKEFITPVVFDLQTKRVTDKYEAGDKYLELGSLLRNSATYDELETATDIAGIKKREVYSVIYEVRDEDGGLKTLVLPVRGRGLWSTLYGFVALDLSDTTSGAAGLRISGLTYYKHGETPGLGGEVDNKLWKAKWRLDPEEPEKNVRVYDEAGDVRVEVSKAKKNSFQVDALSGATLTSNGVTNMLRFWLGEGGFGPYIKSLVTEPADDAPKDGGATVAEPTVQNATESDEQPAAGE